MAHCTVLEPPYKPRKIKRAGGQSLVRQGRAEWIIENILLQMLPAKIAVQARAGRQAPPATPRYIPEKLPSHKAPGTTVDGPLAEKIPETCARIQIANRFAAGYDSHA